MEKKLYTAPVLEINQAEPQSVLAMSFNTAEVEWKDDVNLEVKGCNDWEEIW